MPAVDGASDTSQAKPADAIPADATYADATHADAAHADPTTADAATTGTRRARSDHTLERMREMILSGALPPGSVVSQLTLARTLGVSTTPLREIIHQLQVEGLIEAQFNRRPRVTPLDIEDLQGVYAGRILLESLAIELTVPGMTVADLLLIRADLTEMREHASDSNLDAWSTVHNRFHRRLVVGVPTALASSLTSLFERSERYRRVSAMKDQPRSWGSADQEHQRIVEACEAGQAHTASTELANHLARTALALSAAFAPEVEPKAVRLALRMVGPSPVAGS